MDESRKQFESVMSGKGWSVQKTDIGDYVHERVHLMWMSWKESRTAIEIELPEKIEREIRDTDIDDERRWGHNDAIRDCADAIRAAGIKVKE